MNTRASQFVSVSRENSVLGLNSNSRKPAHDHTRANQFGSVSRENSGLGLNSNSRKTVHEHTRNSIRQCLTGKFRLRAEQVSRRPAHETHAQVNSSASHVKIPAWRLNSNSRKAAHEHTRESIRQRLT